MPQPDTLLFIMLTLVKTLILDVCIHDFGHVWFFPSKDTHAHMCVHIEREGEGTNF